MDGQAGHSSELHIDNRGYAYSSVFLGRIFPAVVTICAISALASLLSAGVTRGTVVPAMLLVLCIAYMIAAFIRRGRHAVVLSLDFLPDQLQVQFFAGAATVNLARIRSFEYEGIQNRARVNVSNAPFPEDGERILVTTLDDGSELRARVGCQHDAALKAIAARQR